MAWKVVSYSNSIINSIIIIVSINSYTSIDSIASLLLFGCDASLGGVSLGTTNTIHLLYNEFVSYVLLTAMVTLSVVVVVSFARCCVIHVRGCNTHRPFRSIHYQPVDESLRLL